MGRLAVSTFHIHCEAHSPLSMERRSTSVPLATLLLPLRHLAGSWSLAFVFVEVLSIFDPIYQKVSTNNPLKALRVFE